MLCSMWDIYKTHGGMWVILKVFCGIQVFLKDFGSIADVCCINKLLFPGGDPLGPSFACSTFVSYDDFVTQ
jgi:hypothetical protein